MTRPTLAVSRRDLPPTAIGFSTRRSSRAATASASGSGGAVGDQVLRVTAERLVAGTRSRLVDEEGTPARGTDIVARLGADEFAIICAMPTPPLAEAEAVASRLLRFVQNPIAVGGHSLRLTASVGLVTTTPAHRHEDELLRDVVSDGEVA